MFLHMMNTLGDKGTDMARTRGKVFAAAILLYPHVRQ